MALAAWASLAVWTIVLARWRRGLAVLPYQPRRPVPWGGLHLLLVLSVYLTPLALATVLAQRLLPEELTRAPAIQKVDDSRTAHAVARLLGEADVRVLWVCALSAVVVAPIVEEFFFRVLLQGWLEAAQRRLRPQMPTLGRLVPGALGPILLTAFLFARMHFRVGAPSLPASFVALMVAADGVAKLLAMTLAVVLLRAGFGATVADLGWVRERFLAEVGLGLLAFAAVAAPTYAAMLLLGSLLPEYLAPDPFVLFPFALVLGTLYYRTHRIVPVIVLHMSLNATSLAMAWLMIAK